MHPTLFVNVDKMGLRLFPTPARNLAPKKGPNQVEIQSKNDKRQFTLTPAVNSLKRTRIIWEGTTQLCERRKEIQEMYADFLTHSYSKFH